MDRLLPFNFSVEHFAGKNMGFAVYFSRHPISAAIPISKEDENFVINLIDSFKFMLKKHTKFHSVGMRQIYQRLGIYQGLKPLNPNIVENPFDQITLENSPDYLLNLHKVLGESFIAEAIKNDTNSNKIRRLIELQNWNAIKCYSKCWYSLRKDISVNPNGCILYDGKMYIPSQLRKTVIDSVHKTQPGQAGMIYLAQLIWYPQIHRDIVALAQRCKQCTRTGKNLKPIIRKNKYTKLPPLSEPNEEIQMDFAGPLTNNKKDTYTGNCRQIL